MYYISWDNSSRYAHGLQIYIRLSQKEKQLIVLSSITTGKYLERH